ncbi:MAG: type II secretion system F family protein [Solirubrobacterales bacterium]|nr:type II secretion system F family protein [Solirubrobacterales bacterium]
MSISTTALAAVRISSVTAAVLLFALTAVVALCGLWLLLSDSARRGEIVVRGGIDLRRRRRLDERLDAILVRTRRGEDLAGKLRSAGIELTPARFLLMVVLVAFGTFALLSLLFPPLLGAAAGAVAGWACFAWLARRLDRRREEFVAQLPDVARLLSNGASAGLSIPAAMELAVREIEAPASEELQTVIDELTFGRSLEESLASLQRRLPSREVAVLMTTLIIQQRAGGDVVQALQELSSTLNTRRDTLREVRTLMAGAMFTSYVVPVMGVGTLFLLNLMNPRTLDQMTTKPLGITALVVAGILYAVGSVLIRRVTRVEL